MKRGLRSTLSRLAGLLCLSLAGTTAWADTAEDFYRGRTITFYVYGAAGGSTDVFGRIIARRIGAYIPGNPTVITKNIPGAGGTTLMNFAYNAGPQDGSALYAPLGGTAPMAQVLSAKGIKYDASKVKWLGNIEESVGIFYTYTRSSTKTMADAMKRETPLAATGKDSNVYQLPILANMLLGTKFKVVLGYPGGAKMELAAESGEVDGRMAIWQTLLATRPDWIKQNRINVLVQTTLTRSAELPNTPTLIELAKTADDKTIFELMALQNVLGRPFFAPQSVPADRVDALRTAFLAVTKDSAVVADVTKFGVEMKIMPGEEVQKAVERMIGTPPHVLARVRKLLGTE